MEKDTDMKKSGTYIICPVCGFIPSVLSPDRHIKEVHKNDE